MIKTQASVLPVKERKCYLPARYVLSFLLFLAMCLDYAQRVCLSMTIVAMVNQTALAQVNSTIDIDDTCPVPTNAHTTAPEEQGDYYWTPSIQGIILGAYFYGYVCTQAVGGRLSEMVGGKWPFGLSILLPSLLTLATPIAADNSVAAIVTVRIIMGLIHGMCMPTAFALFAHWAPVEERSTLISLCVIGYQVGTVVTMPLAGYLCEYGFAGGWPSVYYVFGILGCVWFVFWSCLAYSTPLDHPRISVYEIEYIKKGQIQTIDDQKLPIPWKKILCSLPVWSLTFTSFASFWGHSTLLSELSTYFEVILHIPMQKNGLVSSLIYVSISITLFLSGLASDYLMSKKHFSPTKVRKSFQLFAMMGPALCTGLIPAAGCNETVIIFLLTTAMAFNGLSGGGSSSIAADMAPHHAGTLFGLVNGIGCTAGIFSPLIAGILLEGANSSIHQWNLVFYISSGFYIAGGIIFQLFASAEPQPWADVPIMDKYVNGGIKTHLTIKNNLNCEKRPVYGSMSKEKILTHN